ncbi:MAG TPA: lysine--tRNA ligase [Fimbriiglobus sp.]|nr:lysine--tRNA ligase [Fimbriiglobus sp.]
MSSVPPPPPSPTDPNDHAEVRLEKLRQIEALGLDPWGQRFDGRTPIGHIRELPCEPFDGPQPGPTVRAAGRVVGRRLMGKVYFLDLWDQTGQVQVMAGKKQVGDQGWQILELLDLGDLIGVDGEFGRTKKGEPTIRASALTYLTKSLEPHPSNYYGLHDMEYRLRHRYLDMIYTPDTLRRAQQRVQIIRAIRNHLDAKGYLEVETPTLHAIAGGAAARPFETHHNALDTDLYLRIALELPLKKLLVGGLEQVYEIGRVFRNEGISPRHNPEFTMLELYEAYGDLFSIMDLTEGLIVAAADCLGKGRSLPYGDATVNFEPPFQRVQYTEAFEQHVGVSIHDQAGVRRRAEEAKIALDLRDPKAGTSTPKEHDVLVHELFEHHVEQHLTGPVFVYNYPAALCPLTKRKADDPRLAERFELYVQRMELANAYTELNDPNTQEATFRRQVAGLSEEESMAKMDEDFIRALRHGMPPAGGLGIGIDRLVMLLTDTQSIRDVILFPLLRPEAR